MSEKQAEPKSPGETPAGQSTEAPTAHPKHHHSMSDRLREMADLANRGDNPARLRELQAEVDAEHRLQVQVLLAALLEQAQAEVEEERERNAERVKFFRGECSRTDLTLREARWLCDLFDREMGRLQQLLFLEAKRQQRQGQERALDQRH